jgi:hypothetical protein
MDPLPATTRRRYFLLFIAFFVLVIPLAILYATGYRLSGDFSLIPTGGVYVAVPVSDAEVALNGRVLGVTGLFTRDFYEDNLSPGSYVLSVSLEGYYPWYKTVTVEKSLVTDASALLVPQQLETLELVRGATTTSTTTLGISRTQYDSYLRAFAAAATTSTSTRQTLAARAGLATTSDAELAELGPLPEDTQGGLEVYLDEGNVRLHWARSTTTIPSQLCMTPSSCVRDALIEKGKERAISAHFYGGGVIYATREGGVYLAEADIRPTPLLIPIFSRRGADFRIISNNLIVKDGQKLYQIIGL